MHRAPPAEVNLAPRLLPEAAAEQIIMLPEEFFRVFDEIVLHDNDADQLGHSMAVRGH